MTRKRKWLIIYYRNEYQIDFSLFLASKSERKKNLEGFFFFQIISIVVVNFMSRAFRDESPHRIRKWSDGTNKKGTRSWCKCFFFLFCVDCPRPSVARRAPKRPLRFFLRQQMTHNDKLENFRLFFPSRSLQFVCFLPSFTAKNKISRLFLSLHFVILLLFLRALYFISKKYIFHSLPMSPKCPCVCVCRVNVPPHQRKQNKTKKKREKSLWRQQWRRAINRQKVKRFSRGMSPPPSGYKWDSAKLRGSLFLLPFCLF